MTGGCYHLIYIQVKLVSYVYIYMYNYIYAYIHVIHTHIYIYDIIYRIYPIVFPFLSWYPHDSGLFCAGCPQAMWRCARPSTTHRVKSCAASPWDGLRHLQTPGEDIPAVWRIRDGIGAVGINKWDLKMVSEWDLMGFYWIWMGFNGILFVFLMDFKGFQWDL